MNLALILNLTRNHNPDSSSQPMGRYLEVIYEAPQGGIEEMPSLLQGSTRSLGGTGNVAQDESQVICYGLHQGYS